MVHLQKISTGRSTSRAFRRYFYDLLATHLSRFESGRLLARADTDLGKNFADNAIPTSKSAPAGPQACVSTPFMNEL